MILKIKIILLNEERIILRAENISLLPSVPYRTSSTLHPGKAGREV